MIYMRVTQDKFELPVAVADSVPELAQMCGTTANNIYSQISKCRHGQRKHCAYVRVPEREDGGAM